MRGYQTCPLYNIILTCLTVELGRQHTKAPLAATLSPFMSLLHPPKHDVNDVKVEPPPGSTSPTLLDMLEMTYNYLDPFAHQASEL